MKRWPPIENQVRTLLSWTGNVSHQETGSEDGARSSTFNLFGQRSRILLTETGGDADCVTCRTGWDVEEEDGVGLAGAEQPEVPMLDRSHHTPRFPAQKRDVALLRVPATDAVPGAARSRNGNDPDPEIFRRWDETPDLESKRLFGWKILPERAICHILDAGWHCRRWRCRRWRWCTAWPTDFHLNCRCRCRIIKTPCQ